MNNNFRPKKSLGQNFRRSKSSSSSSDGGRRKSSPPSAHKPSSTSKHLVSSRRSSPRTSRSSSFRSSSSSSYHRRRSRSSSPRRRSRSRNRRRSKDRSKQDKIPSYQGAETNKPYELSELKTITVDIRRTFPSDTSANRRDINPQDIVVYRRPGEGSRPLFDRDDIKVCAGSDERRVTSGSPSRSDRRSGSRRREKSRSRDRGRRRSHSRGRSHSRSRGRGRSRSKDRRNRSRSRRRERRRSRSRTPRRRPLIDTRYAHKRPRSPVADQRLRREWRGREMEQPYEIEPMYSVTPFSLIRPMMYHRPPAIVPLRPFAGIPRVHRMMRYVPSGRCYRQPIYRPPPPAPPSL